MGLVIAQVSPISVLLCLAPAEPREVPAWLGRLLWPGSFSYVGLSSTRLRGEGEASCPVKSEGRSLLAINYSCLLD